MWRQAWLEMTVDQFYLRSVTTLRLPNLDHAQQLGIIISNVVRDFEGYFIHDYRLYEI